MKSEHNYSGWATLNGRDLAAKESAPQDTREEKAAWKIKTQIASVRPTEIKWWMTGG